MDILSMFIYVYGATANVSLLESMPTSPLLVNEILSLHPKAQHHFNIEAPQLCGPFKLQKKTSQDFECQLTTAGTFEIRTAICNDPTTFCKIETFKVEVIDPAKRDSKLIRTPDEERVDKILTQPDSQSFWIQNIAEAQRAAKKENKLILIDFGAEWCPPCNALEEYVFPTKSFKDATQQLIKLRLDVDKKSSRELVEKFHILNYPTLLLANSDFEEIARRLGYNYSDPKNISEWIRHESGHEVGSLERLQKDLDSKPLSKHADADWMRVGLWKYQKHEADAIKYFQKARGREAEKYRILSQWREARDAENRKDEESALKKLLTNFVDDIDYSSWFLKYYEDNHTAAEPFLTVALKNINTWKLKDLSQEDWSLSDLLDSEAQIQILKHHTNEARALYLQAAEYLEKQVRKSPLAMARGANLERAYFLTQAGDAKTAEKIYRSMAELYPNEYTFNFRYARTLYQLKHYDQALAYAEKAIQNSYGPNFYFAKALWGEIQLSRGQRKLARTELETCLYSLKIPKTQNYRFLKAASELRRVLKKLA